MREGTGKAQGRHSVHWVSLRNNALSVGNAAPDAPAVACRQIPHLHRAPRVIALSSGPTREKRTA